MGHGLRDGDASRDARHGAIHPDRALRGGSAPEADRGQEGIAVLTHSEIGDGTNGRVPFGPVLGPLHTVHLPQIAQVPAKLCCGRAGKQEGIQAEITSSVGSNQGPTINETHRWVNASIIQSDVRKLQRS